MPIPRKGSKIICLDDIQYRWIAYSTPKGTEVRVSYNEFPDGQMLIAQVPKLFNLKWIEPIIDFGLEHGWEPGEISEPFYIRKNRDTYRLLEPNEIPEK